MQDRPRFPDRLFNLQVRHGHHQEPSLKAPAYPEPHHETSRKVGVASSTMVLSPHMAARATFAVKTSVWFRRARFVIILYGGLCRPAHHISPVYQPSWLLSGRNSTY